MMETSARLLRLLSLLQTHRDWSGAELADRLGITPRTVRRDVDKLRTLDYPIIATAGVAGGYRLGAGAALPPLLLDDEEAVAVAVGLRTAAGGTVAGIEETSVRALAKLEQVLPSRLRRRVNTLQSVTVPLAGGGTTVDADALVVISAACRDHERLRFDYRRHDGEQARRVVEPQNLAHTGRRWYLLAWDVDRSDWRTFRVDRIVLKPPAGPRFTPRDDPPGGVAAHLTHGLTTGVYRYQARITLHAPAQRVADKVPPTIAAVEATDAATCTLRAGADSLDALALRIALLGIDFDVHEPPELVAHVRTLAARLARAVPERPDEA